VPKPLIRDSTTSPVGTTWQSRLVASWLRERQEWKFFAILPNAHRGLAFTWWLLLLLAGTLPAVFAIAMGWTVAAVQSGAPLGSPLLLVGTLFVVEQVVGPIRIAVSQNLGDLVSAWLNESLISSCVVPPGVGHLEDPALRDDLIVARDFDRGQTAPPMSLNVQFVSDGLVGIVAGLTAAMVLAGFAWWAPVVLVIGWGSTHWLLRESAVWKDRNTAPVRSAQRDAEYVYRLAVDPQPAKEVRLFGLPGWVVDRFVERRRLLFELQYRATRLREKPVAWCLILILAANAAVFAALGWQASTGALPLDRLVTFAVVASAIGRIAFGGFSWALDGAAAPVAAVERLAPVMGSKGALAAAAAQGQDPRGRPAHSLRVRDLSFRYPDTDRLIFDGLDLTIPAGMSLAIVGQNGAGKTTLAKLLCRLYDPTSGAIEVDGIDLRSFDVDPWRRRITAVFQDFVRFELTLRQNVDPSGTATDDDVLAALADAGADQLAELDTTLAKGYPGGTDLSGGQWQRVALARALCAVRGGAGLVLLDEPTAQLDVRGEAEVFDRLLTATREVTTILISHRFSTVRHADRICVLERGRVIELGSHHELMAQGGRYRRMFDLQAKRFEASMDEEGAVFDVL
jgi:ATP-binding cassette, subfamily B, bacterial